MFIPLENAIAQKLIPSLFDGSTPPRRRTKLTIKSGGLGFRDPLLWAPKSYAASAWITEYLVKGIRRKNEFILRDHSIIVKELKSDWMKGQKITEDIEFSRIIGDTDKELIPCMERTRVNGGWLSISPSIDNGTFLTKGEFHDAIRLRYGLTPNNLNAICNGCGEKFSIDHAFNCRRGGLIIQRHDEVKNEISSVFSKALSPKAVHGEPEIYPCLDGKGVQKSDRGDIAVTGFWQHNADCIFDL